MKSQAIVAYGKPLEEVTSDIPVPTGTQVVVQDHLLRRLPL